MNPNKPKDYELVRQPGNVPEMVPFNVHTGEGIEWGPNTQRPGTGLHPSHGGAEPQVAFQPMSPPPPTGHDYGHDSQSTRPSQSQPPEPSSPSPGEYAVEEYQRHEEIKPNDPKAPLGYEYRVDRMHGPGYYPKKWRDSAPENALEYIPWLGTVLSLDDIQRANAKTKDKSSWENLKNVAPEVFGALPAGKAASSALRMSNPVRKAILEKGTNFVNQLDTATDLLHDNIRPYLP